MPHVYHWRHGWIPLTHEAALSKAKGNHRRAGELLAAAHGPGVGINNRRDVTRAASTLHDVPATDRRDARHQVITAAREHGVTTIAPNEHQPVTAHDLTAASDDHLSTLLGDAATRGDSRDLDAVIAELSRRDAAAKTADTKRERAREQRAARADRHHAARDQHFDQLVAAGQDPEHAYAAAFGVSVERQRRTEVIASLRASGFTGPGFDVLTRNAYQHELEKHRLAAETATRGHMLNAEGRRARVRSDSLFTGTEATARKYASDELKHFWDEHTRPTLQDYRASLLGGSAKQRTTGDSWLR